MRNVVIPQKTVPIDESTQVLVVGGGPAGIGAAVSAVRMGMKTMLLEKRGFLGGNITASYVESCNYFMHNTGFKPEGIFLKIEQRYKEKFPADDLRPNSPHRFHSEKLKIFLDEFIQKEGVSLKLHAFVNDVVISNDSIEAVIIQTKQGPKAIKAQVVIDCTGDADVAFSAGVPFLMGRDKDNLCQPGTVNFRLTGADVPALISDGDNLKAIGKRFKETYRKGETGLRCKRQDLPFGRLTHAGQISYVNYACAYGIDPTSIEGLTKGEIECRSYIYEIYQYLKRNYQEFKATEITSIAPEIGFRDSRRIYGEYTLTIKDMENQTEFPDCIVVYPRFYDMLSPDANMEGDGSVAGSGYEGHIYEPIVDTRCFEIPYRSLLPVNTDNLLVAGRCISCDHVAQSGIRAISLCMMTGQAAGTAAGIILKKATDTRNIDIKDLQQKLREGGFSLPES